jgi:hypothetical protein
MSIYKITRELPGKRSSKEKWIDEIREKQINPVLHHVKLNKSRKVHIPSLCNAVRNLDSHGILISVAVQQSNLNSKTDR